MKSPVKKNSGTKGSLEGFNSGVKWYAVRIVQLLADRPYTVKTSYYGEDVILRFTVTRLLVPFFIV